MSVHSAAALEARILHPTGRREGNSDSFSSDSANGIHGAVGAGSDETVDISVGEVALMFLGVLGGILLIFLALHCCKKRRILWPQMQAMFRGGLTAGNRQQMPSQARASQDARHHTSAPPDAVAVRSAGSDTLASERSVMAAMQPQAASGADAATAQNTERFYTCEFQSESGNDGGGGSATLDGSAVPPPPGGYGVAQMSFSQLARCRQREQLHVPAAAPPTGYSAAI
jgi:hypothetical protein